MRWILLVLVILLASSIPLCSQPGQPESGQESQPAATLYNVTLDSGYFDKLKGVIEGDTTPKEKEKAILEMAQIAVMLNDSDRAIEYLKEVASTSKDQNVVAAAYAAIDLIRDYYPPEVLGELAVDVEGDLKPGSTVNITATVKAYSDCEGMVGIKRGVPEGMELKSNIRYKFEISAEETKKFTFVVKPEQSDEYALTIALFLEKSRFDYQQVEQEIVLRVDESGGEVVYY
ncbi:COG1470 family protein [Archaeoglobus fulgidus]|nr:hypothetical protein [Archaeoglobus fulgidus]